MTFSDRSIERMCNMGLAVASLGFSYLITSNLRDAALVRYNDSPSQVRRYDANKDGKIDSNELTLVDVIRDSF